MNEAGPTSMKLNRPDKGYSCKDSPSWKGIWRLASPAVVVTHTSSSPVSLRVIAIIFSFIQTLGLLFSFQVCILWVSMWQAASQIKYGNRKSSNSEF